MSKSLDDIIFKLALILFIIAMMMIDLFAKKEAFDYSDRKWKEVKLIKGKKDKIILKGKDITKYVKPLIGEKGYYLVIDRK